MNRGIANMGQALQYRQQMERQAAQDRMSAESHALQDKLARMGIAKNEAENAAVVQGMQDIDPTVQDLPGALTAQMKQAYASQQQKTQGDKLTRYTSILKELETAPFDNASKTNFLKAAMGKDPDFAEFLNTMVVQTQPKPGDFDTKTLYGPDSATKTVPVSKTAPFTPEPGWTLTAPQKSDILSPGAEAQKIRIQKAGKEGMGGGEIPKLTGGGVPGQRDDRALEGATSGEQAIVKQLVDYRIPLPSGFALKSPYWQNIMQRAALYDPSFDASQYNVRLKLRNDFNSGKAAANIRSLNTAVNHLESLYKASEELENSPVQLWNRISNYGLTQTGDSRVTKFNTAATAVEGELANVFKNTGATDQEIKAWRANLSAVQSPRQLKDNIESVIELLGGRLGALQGQYEAGMGKPKDFKMLSDRSRKILSRIGADVESIDPVTAKNDVQPRGSGDWNTILSQAKAAVKSGKSKQGTEDILIGMGYTKSQIDKDPYFKGWLR